MQVRKRFPTPETLVAAGLITNEELDILDNIHDPYSRYWTPIQWCYNLLYEAKEEKKIASDHLLEKITDEIQHFRHGLSSLLKYDWVPVPLVYPQVIFLSVRVYFLICLIGRQFIVREGAEHKSEIDLWLPITTMIQFTVYIGWMKVAEALLNPLGEDDDDLECNYVIDKNLITGLNLVDVGGKSDPPQNRDDFWDQHMVAPLYSLEAARRTVHPLVGSASRVKQV
ncbi:Protein BEST-22 d [Aphelenchoides avenae]|nr:Protein BEST-22 d [Aphelenchus avenae]